eukprot:Selendium_serpulae@DN5822_c0_g1_i3.p1
MMASACADKPDAGYDRCHFKATEAESSILVENPNRWVILPLQFPDIWNRYKIHESTFWTAEDISYKDDQESFHSLSESLRAGLQRMMAFNAAGCAPAILSIIKNTSFQRSRSAWGWNRQDHNVIGNRSESRSKIIFWFSACHGGNTQGSVLQFS